MDKALNRKAQHKLKEFKKGHRLPRGYKAVFQNGIYKTDVHSNGGKNTGEKVGEVTEYEEPQFDIFKDDEHIFSVQWYNEKIITIGDSDADEVENWDEAFKKGIEYFNEDIKRR